MSQPQLADTRQEAILEVLHREGGVVISALAAQLGVSEMTVRRDLRALEARGAARRVHGGAVLAASGRFGDRMVKSAPEKARAARKLIPYLPIEGTIYLDGSTTMLNLLDELAHRNHLQVATNNAETFRRLAALDSVQPLLIGGSLDRRTDNLVGALALRSALAIAFDAAFFSCWGLTSELGPMELTIEDAEVKEVIAGRSRQVFLAVDHEKLGVTAAGAWRPDRAKTRLATDLPAHDTRLAGFDELFAVVE